LGSRDAHAWGWNKAKTNNSALATLNSHIDAKQNIKPFHLSNGIKLKQ